MTSSCVRKLAGGERHAYTLPTESRALVWPIRKEYTVTPDKKKGQKHIVLTSHPGTFGARPSPIVWGHSEPQQRGPVIATLTDMRQRNTIGTHGGAYAIYRAKAAIEPVWYLPGVAQRFDVDESTLRHTLFEQTGGMFPELVTRPDLAVFLPPIGGLTVYIVGSVATMTDPTRPLAVRVHDECNGSDVFSSDICTCRPYLVHGIEVCVQTAHQGGVGVIVYCRKEGRALGEVTKFLVYNARKRQAGGDRADTYFRRTECVAGAQDMRFQELMPDIFHWLGIRRIDRWVSMSNLKRDALIGQGIEVIEQVAIPERLVPLDAAVEIEAKKAAGY